MILLLCLLLTGLFLIINKSMAQCGEPSAGVVGCFSCTTEISCTSELQTKVQE